MSVVDRIFHGARDWSLGGPIGALLERAASHLPQHLPHIHLHHEPRPADDPRRRVAFTVAVIALGAKMARADGEVTREATYGDVHIGDRCWIGTRAMVMPGVTIGEGTVIGAGALVTKDCDPGAVYVGVPAKRVR